jgi:hypothetical protein
MIGKDNLTKNLLSNDNLYPTLDGKTYIEWNEDNDKPINIELRNQQEKGLKLTRN